MSATDFLPRREIELRNWSARFCAKIVAEPEAYGLTAELAADYRVKNDAFVAAFDIANKPDTRTTGAVQAKNTAMRPLRKAARKLARIIHSRPDVSGEQKTNLGLTVRRPGGRVGRLPRPGSAPWLRIEAIKGRRITLALSDPVQPFRRGLPVGVDMVMIMAYVGDRPPEDSAGWYSCGMTTKMKFVTTLPDHVPPGTPVWFAAIWQNPRGQMGPAGPAVLVHAQTGLGATGSLRSGRAA